MTSSISDSSKNFNPSAKDDFNILLKIKKLSISRIEQSLNCVIDGFIENESIFYRHIGVYNIKYIEKMLDAIEKDCLHFLNSSLLSSFEVVYSNLLKLFDIEE